MAPRSWQALAIPELVQLVPLPWEFALPTEKALIRKDGDKLIIDPVRTAGLLAVLASLEDIETTFPEMDEALLPPDNVEL